jgi:hypothetical protein
LRCLCLILYYRVHKDFIAPRQKNPAVALVGKGVVAPKSKRTARETTAKTKPVPPPSASTKSLTDPEGEHITFYSSVLISCGAVAATSAVLDATAMDAPKSKRKMKNPSAKLKSVPPPSASTKSLTDPEGEHLTFYSLVLIAGGAAGSPSAVLDTTAMDECDYPNCILDRAASLRRCACGQGHHHICAIKAGFEEQTSLCAGCLPEELRQSVVAAPKPVVPEDEEHSKKPESQKIDAGAASEGGNEGVRTHFCS